MKKRISLFPLILLSLFTFSVKAQDTRLIDSLKQLLTKSQPDSVRLKILDDLCWETGFINLDQALAYGQQGIKEAIRVGNKPMEAQLNSDLAAVYARYSEFEKSILYYRKAFRMFQKLGNTKKVVSSTNNLSQIYKYLGKYELALRYGIVYLKTSELLNDTSLIIYAYSNIAALYNTLENNQKALEYALISYKKALVYNDKKHLFLAYSSLALAYYGLKDYKNALNYSLNMITYLENRNEWSSSGNVYNNISQYYSELKQYEKSNTYSLKSISCFQKIGDTHGIGVAYKSLAINNFRLKNYAAAEKYALASLPILKADKTPRPLTEVYDILAKVNESRNAYQEAYRYQALYTKLNDSLYKRESIEKLAQMQTAYEIDKKENQNKLLAQDNEIKSLEINRKTTLLGIVGGLAFIILIFFYLSYNRYRIKTRLKELEALQKVHNERERISKDLHDNIGSQLTYTTLKLNEKASKTADEETTALALIIKNTIGQLRETIWTLKKDEVSVTELGLRIRQYLNQFFKYNEGVDCRFDLLGETTDHVISPTQSLNLFRIMQEAIQNIMKHSAASEILVQLMVNTDKRVQLIIKDNGKGFDVETAKSESYGLIHMQERAEELGGRFNIISALNKGTEINIYL